MLRDIFSASDLQHVRKLYSIKDAIVKENEFKWNRVYDMGCPSASNTVTQLSSDVKNKSENYGNQIKSAIELSEDLINSVAKLRELIPQEKRIVFVSGNFNIVHPGHFRLLKFAAECGDFLIVGVNHDAIPGTLIPQHLRVQGLEALEHVNLVTPLFVSAEQFIAYLQPDVVVKGNEHEHHFNPEQAIIDNYGGKLLFSSGEMRFSSMDLLRSEFQEILHTTIKKPVEYIERHGINQQKLSHIMRRFSELSVVVIGDLIIDEYVTCEALGISREDPTLVVTPLARDLYVGAAGIVAAHARALGAQVSYFGVVGNDASAKFAKNELKKFDVDAHLLQDLSRPTTLKQRYRADGKTLLRISELRHHHIDAELIDKMYKQLTKFIQKADLVIFSDFNYGCLPQALVDAVINFCNKHGIPMVADSQSSSQIGDVSRFHSTILLTPTEHEARLAMRDQTSGLVGLAEALIQKTRAEHIMITLGAEGVLVHSPHSSKHQLTDDQIPALNTAPKDVAGGGDALLVSSALALAAGATIWESAYIGSVAAACHVGRTGNLPLAFDQILRELSL